VRGSSLEGLWVILVAENGNKVPLMAKAGNGTYLLAFRTGFTARKLMVDRVVSDGEPRLILKHNIAELIGQSLVQSLAGVLIDYDAQTNKYREAGLMY